MYIQFSQYEWMNGRINEWMNPYYHRKQRWFNLWWFIIDFCMVFSPWSLGLPLFCCSRKYAHTHKQNEIHFFVTAAQHSIFLFQHLFRSLSPSLSFRSQTLYPLQPKSFYHIYEWISSWALSMYALFFSNSLLPPTVSPSFFLISQIWQNEIETHERRGAHNVWIKKLHQREIWSREKMHRTRGAAMAMAEKCVFILCCLILSYSKVKFFRWPMSKNSMRSQFCSFWQSIKRDWAETEGTSYWKRNWMVSYGSGARWLIIMIFGTCMPEFA